AVGAVAFFEATGGAVDADADRRDAERLAGLPDQVPQACALLEGHVQFPAQLADVRDARGEDVHGPDVDAFARAEWEGCVRQVAFAERPHQLARARAPDAQRGPGRGRVEQLHRIVGGQM